MKRDEFIFLAREAGLDFSDPRVKQLFSSSFALGAAREREACAKVCDELSKKHSWEGCYANECAEEIRARGDEAT